MHGLPGIVGCVAECVDSYECIYIVLVGHDPHDHQKLVAFAHHVEVEFGMAEGINVDFGHYGVATAVGIAVIIELQVSAGMFLWIVGVIAVLPFPVGYHSIIGITVKILTIGCRKDCGG